MAGVRILLRICECINVKGFLIDKHKDPGKAASAWQANPSSVCVYVCVCKCTCAGRYNAVVQSVKRTCHEHSTAQHICICMAQHLYGTAYSICMALHLYGTASVWHCTAAYLHLYGYICTFTTSVAKHRHRCTGVKNNLYTYLREATVIITVWHHVLIEICFEHSEF